VSCVCGVYVLAGGTFVRVRVCVCVRTLRWQPCLRWAICGPYVICACVGYLIWAVCVCGMCVCCVVCGCYLNVFFAAIGRK